MLFLNLKGKRFRLATRDAGPYFDAEHVGRGAAFGDIDNDGDIDIVVNHKDAAPALLRNDTKSDNHWIRLELRGTRSNRDAIGTRVEVEVGGRTIFRQRKGGYSLESSNDPRLLIGVGPVARWIRSPCAGRRGRSARSNTSRPIGRTRSSSRRRRPRRASAVRSVTRR